MFCFLVQALGCCWTYRFVFVVDKICSRSNEKLHRKCKFRCFECLNDMYMFSFSLILFKSTRAMLKRSVTVTWCWFFFKSFLERQGVLDRLWVLSLVNAFYMSFSDLLAAVSRYRGYNRLLAKFNKIFRPTRTAPDQNCVICMSELLNCRKLAPCGHLFHYKCLFQWVQTKKECPVCRSPINIDEWGSKT